VSNCVYLLLSHIVPVCLVVPKCVMQKLNNLVAYDSDWLQSDRMNQLNLFQLFKVLSFYFIALL
jgi:hypothetical protein